MGVQVRLAVGSIDSFGARVSKPTLVGVGECLRLWSNDVFVFDFVQHLYRMICERKTRARCSFRLVAAERFLYFIKIKLNTAVVCTCHVLASM